MYTLNNYGHKLLNQEELLEGNYPLIGGKKVLLELLDTHEIIRAVYTSKGVIFMSLESFNIWYKVNRPSKHEYIIDSNWLKTLMLLGVLNVRE